MPANQAKMSDTEALDVIHQILDGNEHDSDTADRVANIVEMTGRQIADPGDYTREELETLIKDDWLETFAAKDLVALLSHGFKGLDNMSYSALLKHAEDASLIEPQE